MGTTRGEYVELSDHSLILAENTPAETFVDNVERLSFDNWADHEALYGHLATIEEMELPRARSQRQISIPILARLDERVSALGRHIAAA